ncbi:trehalase-like [Branchiostoma floridae]|uniref:Trehalase n=1 Tax=Branchiostoma floridae TaxID=7739 RepID=A0A9J7MES4_BRAFL|nr:trehalase-like [Branchiostoma floridae]
MAGGLVFAVLAAACLCSCRAQRWISGGDDQDGTALRDIPACDSPVYCYGALLNAVQSTRVFKDSKTFVDMSMKSSPEDILGAFDNMRARGQDIRSREVMRRFVSQWFSGPGAELEDWEPSDWQERPAFLNGIRDESYREWAEDLHGLWKKLSKRVSRDVRDYPERHSSMYVPYPFIIPGGEHREMQYWDTYWTVRGLLLSNMLETVQGILENFAEMVQRFGYVPGGGRVYQSKRSGPPLLIPTVLEYLEHSNDITLIRSLLPTLEREYDFWMNNRTVDIRGSDGSMHTLNRYHVLVGQSRPEAWRLDERTARSLQRGADPADFHSHVATAVESGWEFSSRWLADVGPQARTLASIRTRNIVPVDLNAMMCLNEVALSRIYQRAGDRRKAGYYNNAAARRRVAMDKVLWSERRGAWFDYDLQAEGRRDRFYVSNIWPLWAKCYGNGMGDANVEARVLSYLKQYTDVLNYTGGVPASLQESGQAWDYPYGTAPNHFVLIEALSVSQLTEAKNAALNLTRKWLESNYRDWVHTGAMWDTYNVITRRRPRNSDEEVKDGYGWTNGVALHLLDKYGNLLKAPDVSGSRDNHVPTALLLIACLVSVLLTKL